MKHLTLIAAALLTVAAAQAAMPQGELFASFVTDKGAREKESERYVTVYFKSSVANDTVYLQFGTDAAIDTLPIAKANTMVNIKKSGLSGANIPVRIWAPTTIWFLNINSGDITSFQPGTCTGAIREFRCENDSLNNMDFLPQMTALEYFVCSNNRRVKSITVNNPNLQRAQFNKLPALQSINVVSAPELYEFKLDLPLIPSLDLSVCSKLKTFLCTNAPNLTEVKFGPGQALTEFTLSGTTALQKLEFSNLPLLKNLQLYENSALANVVLTNLPALATLNLRDDNVSDCHLQNLPALRTLTLSGNPFATLDLDLPDLTSVTIDRCLLDTIDLSRLAALKSGYIRNGEVKNIKFNATALQSTITTLQLANNQIGISNLPPRPGKMSATLNYYAPQAQPVLPKTIYVKDVVDLSAWTTGHTLTSTVPSEIKWETIFEEELEPGYNYTVEDGKFVFLHHVEDSVRCFITNSAFPDFARKVDSKGNVTDYRIISNYTLIQHHNGVQDVRDDARLKVSSNTPLTIDIIYSGNAEAAVYTIEGHRVATTRVGGKTSIAVPAPGIYLVRVLGKTAKIAVR